MQKQTTTTTVTTPLGPDQLLFTRMTGHEEISRLFEFEVELRRPEALGSVNVRAILGKSMSIKMQRSNGATRYFDGAVAELKHTGSEQRFYKYRAILRPWLWFLTLKSNCRIFQDKTIPDIVKAIFADYSFADVEYQYEGSYETLDYCVQYRESDFNFISRIMEHAGMFYFFKHQKGKHTLVIADSGNAYQQISNYKTIPYFPPENVAERERDHIFQWLSNHQVLSGKFELDDFNFETPSTDLTAKSQHFESHDHDKLEVYDYPGKYKVANIGTGYADKRIEEIHAQYATKQAAGNALALQPGLEFTLDNFYFDEENVKHYIQSCDYKLGSPESTASGIEEISDIFCCNFTAINSKQTFHPARLTHRPVISGSQTAIVVGKDGEEIWTDKYGRVKVKFHWDRDTERNEKSSCWLRVSYPMAGKQWGWISLPRIGQEVIVSFLEGDPDRPLITGRVYNAEQMPPYELPSKQTQSGIKTRSSKQGVADNFNEIRFEDKKGSEELYVHAEKDFNCVIENNETRKIGVDKKDKGNQTVEVQNDRAVTLNQGNDTLTVKTGNRETNIDQGNDTKNVKMGNHSIKVNMGTSTIEAMQSIELKVGMNSIKIEQSGITINGVMVTAQATTKLTLSGLITMIN